MDADSLRPTLSLPVLPWVNLTIARIIFQLSGQWKFLLWAAMSKAHAQTSKPLLSVLQHGKCPAMARTGDALGLTNANMAIGALLYELPFLKMSSRVESGCCLQETGRPGMRLAVMHVLAGFRHCNTGNGTACGESRQASHQAMPEFTVSWQSCRRRLVS